MTIKNWLRLFWTTLIVGMLAAAAAGGVLITLFKDFTLMELSNTGFNWQTALFVVLAGSTISVISHVGFFSYLIVRDIFLGFLRSRVLWDILQVILVFVAFEMLTYVRWTVFGGQDKNWLDYTVLPGLLLAASMIIALLKTGLTNRLGFIPTLFFMYTATILEALPALRLNSTSSIMFMIVPLFAGNAWQVLFLPRFLKKKTEPAAASSI